MSGKVWKKIPCKESLLLAKQNNKMRVIVFVKVSVVNQLVYLGVGREEGEQDRG